MIVIDFIFIHASTTRKPKELIATNIQKKTIKSINHIKENIKRSKKEKENQMVENINHKSKIYD